MRESKRGLPGVLSQKMGQTSIGKQVVRFCLLCIAVALQAAPFGLFWLALSVDTHFIWECNGMIQKFASMPVGTPASAIKRAHGEPDYITNVYRREQDGQLVLREAEWVYLCSDTPVRVFLDSQQKVTHVPPPTFLTRSARAEAILLMLHIAYLLGIGTAILLFGGNRIFLRLQVLALGAILCLDILAVTVIFRPLTSWVVRASWLALSALLAYLCVVYGLRHLLLLYMRERTPKSQGST